jgi:hypothetical protein
LFIFYVLLTIPTNGLPLHYIDYTCQLSRLEDPDADVRFGAIFTLGNKTTLLDTILQVLVSRLEDTDSVVRRAAVDAEVRRRLFMSQANKPLFQTASSKL